MKPEDNPERTALLAIDLQRDFLDPAGRMSVSFEDAVRVVKTSTRLIRLADAVGWKIIFIKNEFPAGDWFGNIVRRGAAIKGSAGAEFDPRIAVPATASVVSKRQADAFGNPLLEPMLQGASIRRLVILGVMTEACVRATAKSGLKRGFDVTIVADGIASSSRFLHRLGVCSLRRAGATILDRPPLDA